MPVPHVDLSFRLHPQAGPQVTIEAWAGDVRLGELTYVLADDYVGPHCYIADLTVVASARRRGVASALLEALAARESLPLYVAPRSYNTKAGNDTFDAWNRRHPARPVRWHAEPF